MRLLEGDPLSPFCIPGLTPRITFRYTVHEKAQNFTVPIPLTTSWATEQIDELFTSLLGGAGLAGAGAERDDQGVMGAVDAVGEDGLGGLRVF